MSASPVSTYPNVCVLLRVVGGAQRESRVAGARQRWGIGRPRSRGEMRRTWRHNDMMKSLVGIMWIVLVLISGELPTSYVLLQPLFWLWFVFVPGFIFIWKYLSCIRCTITRNMNFFFAKFNEIKRKKFMKIYFVRLKIIYWLCFSKMVTTLWLRANKNKPLIINNFH